MTKLPKCEGYVTGEHWNDPWTVAVGDRRDPLPGVTAADLDVDGRYCLPENGETVDAACCERWAHRSEIDQRFGLSLCRECFYAAAHLWRDLNRAAGLCACGMDCMPMLNQCRECNARSRRQAAAVRNRQKLAAAARAKLKAKRAAIDAERAEADRLVASFTHDTVRAAMEAAGGDKPQAAAALGLRRKPSNSTWGSDVTPVAILSSWLRRKANVNVWPPTR